MDATIIGVVILSVTLAAVISAYGKLQKRLRELESSGEEVVNQARKESVKIISQAHEEAAKILVKASDYKLKTEEFLAGYLEDATKQELSLYRKNLQSISNNINERALREMDEMVQRRYTQVEEMLNSYKEKRLREIKDRIGDLMRIMSIRALQRSLSFEEHRKLVEDAIDEAYKQHVI